tara:strand:+ start:122 stop:409 length:288 start_codon:yes stop_codon:yes gene_type:complete
MSIRKLYRLPVEDSAKHIQFKNLCLEYFKNYDKLMQNSSRRYAERARKALIRLKKVAHELGLDYLRLYAPSLNPGKEPINIKNKTIELKESVNAS